MFPVIFHINVYIFAQLQAQHSNISLMLHVRNLIPRTVNDIPGGLTHIGQTYLLDADDVSSTTQTVCCQHKHTVHYA